MKKTTMDRPSRSASLYAGPLRCPHVPCAAGRPSSAVRHPSVATSRGSRTSTSPSAITRVCRHTTTSSAEQSPWAGPRTRTRRGLAGRIRVSCRPDDQAWTGRPRDQSKAARRTAWRPRGPLPPPRTRRGSQETHRFCKRLVVEVDADDGQCRPTSVWLVGGAPSAHESGPHPAPRRHDEARATSSVGSTTWRRSNPLDTAGRRSAISSRRRSIMARPISSMGWRTLVRGGSMWRAIAESS